MSKENALVPVEQREIGFYNDQVIAVLAEDKTVYVPVRPLCQLLGIAWEAQARKLRNDPVLSDVTMSVIIRSQTSPDSKRPETSTMIALPLDFLNGWLFGINANRVKESVRDNLMRYQRECYRVLFEAFGRNDLTVRPDEELMQAASPEGEAYRIALSVAKLARQQYYLTKRVEDTEQWLGALDERLSLVEANLGDDKRFVTKEQATNISQGVRAIALVLTKRSNKNEYGGVYGELYRFVGVSSYKEIPAVRYEKAMSWLRNWYIELTDESDVPF